MVGSGRNRWKAAIALKTENRQLRAMAMLSIVEDVFQISGRGSVVVVPGIPRAGDWRIKVGDSLRLRLPDGTDTQTVVGGIEMASPPNPVFIPLLLGKGLAKGDVPIGTEIWID